MRALALALLLIPPQEKPALRDQIEAAVAASRIKDGRAGVLVHSARDGRAVYALHERDPFLLASNTKLLTTAAALVKLGPAFVFRTPVGLAGEDLHVAGAGDPNISGRFHDDDPVAVFKRWAAKLKAAGVTQIRDVVLHTGAFDGPSLNPGWKDYDPWWWWAAPFGPLSLNDNCVDITVDPGADGEPCRVALSPDTGYVKIVNNAKSARRPARPFGFTRRPGTNTITLSGELAAKTTYSVTIHDPAQYFGTVLLETFAKAGVSCVGKLAETRDPLPEGFKEVDAAEHALADTLAACNQPSQNFYAEMILRVLGAKAKGAGTLDAGLEAVRDFLEKDVKADTVSQADGSGLTRENRGAPADLVKLLLYMKDQKAFVDSLPVSGAEKGTLRRRMLGPDVRGRVRAKTGHLSGISTLSGYVDAKGGDTFTFSILVNAGGGDALQDRICEILARN
ncbi:MAG TPA: D-alanyl-D-alanine carboxypeptidase/D-alanyl-D-alanine-endopeptidase [Planctomycetota bacterium]